MNIYLDESKGRGRGVFASRNFLAGTVIEEAPVVLLPISEEDTILNTKLSSYYYQWNEDSIAIALGYGSLYNHSYDPNAIFICGFDKQEMHYIALKDIKPGEEVFVNYNGDPEDQTPVWFDVV